MRSTIYHWLPGISCCHVVEVFLPLSGVSLFAPVLTLVVEDRDDGRNPPQEKLWPDSWEYISVVVALAWLASTALSGLRCGVIQCFGLHWRILFTNLLRVKLRLRRSYGLPPVGCRITTGPLVDVWCDLSGSLQPTRVMDAKLVLTVMLASLFVSPVCVCVDLTMHMPVVGCSCMKKDEPPYDGARAQGLTNTFELPGLVM